MYLSLKVTYKDIVLKFFYTGERDVTIMDKGSLKIVFNGFFWVEEFIACSWSHVQKC